MAANANWRPFCIGNIGNIVGTTRTPIARFRGLRGCQKAWIAMTDRRAVLRSLGHSPRRAPLFDAADAPVRRFSVLRDGCFALDTAGRIGTAPGVKVSLSAGRLVRRWVAAVMFQRITTSNAAAYPGVRRRRSSGNGESRAEADRDVTLVVFGRWVHQPSAARQAPALGGRGRGSGSAQSATAAKREAG